MGIEINNASGRTPQDVGESRQSTAPQNAASPARAGSAGQAGSGGDKLALSDQAAQLQALESQIANLPVVDTQRVQDVQHSMATGAFQIEPAQVADKMLSFEAGLGPES